MGYYAYKVCLYDIDYEKYKQLVEQFEKEYGRECDCDSNYDGDNWYIAAMWIEQLRKRVAELEEQLIEVSKATFKKEIDEAAKLAIEELKRNEH